jgi:hypothetical protein
VPGVAAGAAPSRPAGAGVRGGGQLPAGRVRPAGGEAGRVAGADGAEQVAGRFVWLDALPQGDPSRVR